MPDVFDVLTTPRAKAESSPDPFDVLTDTTPRAPARTNIASDLAAQVLAAPAKMVTTYGEGAARLGSRVYKKLTGDKSLNLVDRAANRLRTLREDIGESLAPESTTAAIGGGVADLAANVLPYVATGGAASLPAAAAVSAGLTGVQSQAGRDASTVGMIADLTGSKRLQDIAASPTSRTALDMALDVVLSGASHGAGKLVSARKAATAAKATEEAKASSAATASGYDDITTPLAADARAARVAREAEKADALSKLEDTKLDARKASLDREAAKQKPKALPPSPDEATNYDVETYRLNRDANAGKRDELRADFEARQPDEPPPPPVSDLAEQHRAQLREGATRTRDAADEAAEAARREAEFIASLTPQQRAAREMLTRPRVVEPRAPEPTPRPPSPAILAPDAPALAAPRRTVTPEDMLMVGRVRAAELESGVAPRSAPDLRPAMEREGRMFGDLPRTRAGGASLQAVNTLAGGGAGAFAGSQVGATPEERTRNAMIGATVGLALPSGVTFLATRRAKAGVPSPAYLADPDVRTVLGTIARGERSVTPPSHNLSVAQRVYRAIFDDLYPLRVMGRNLGAGEQVGNLAVRASGSQGASEQYLYDHLRPILEQTKGNEEGVMALMKAQRDLLDLRPKGLTKTDLTEPVLQSTIAKLEAIPEVKQGAEALRGYFRQLLDMQYAEGMLTKDRYDAIKASGDYYSPFVREWDAAQSKVGKGGGGRFTNRGAQVKRMDKHLASAKTVDPYEVAVQATADLHKAVGKQRVTQAIAGLEAVDPQAAAPWVTRLAKEDEGAKLGGRTIRTVVDGEQRIYHVNDPDLYAAWEAITPSDPSVLMQVLRFFKTVKQLGVTTTPGFVVRNALRDNAQVATQAGRRLVGESLVGSTVGAASGAITGEDDKLRRALIGAGIGMGAGPIAGQGIRSARAIGQVLMRGPEFQQFLRDGGEAFGFYPRSAKDARAMLEQMRRTRAFAPSDLVSPKRWVDALRMVSSAVEQAPRLTTYTAMKAGGATADQAVQAARDVSLNFARKGTVTGKIGEAAAFFNPTVQGWDKLGRMLAKPSTYVAGAAIMTAPSIALWAVNKDNPDYWKRPVYERNLFWLIPKEEGGFVRLPKPFELGYLFASLPERMLDYMHQKAQQNPAAQQQLDAALANFGAGLIPGVLPSALQPAIEVAANKDFFRDRPVEPRTDVDPALRLDDRTSSVAKLTGRATGTSPQKIDYLVKGYGGTLAGGVLDVADRVLRATGADTRPLQAGTNPAGLGLTTREGGSTAEEQSFRDRFRDAEMAYRSARELANRADVSKNPDDVTAARAYVRENIERLRQYKALKEADAMLDKVSKQRRAVRANAALGAAERKAQLAALDRVAHDLVTGARGARGSTQAGGVGR